MTNTSLTDNSAGFLGGGIENDGENGHATVRVSIAQLSGNSAGADSGTTQFSGGGGIFNDGYSGHADLTLSDCMVNDNRGGAGGGSTLAVGGGLSNHGYYGDATATVTNCTISHNVTDLGGGGVNNFGSYGTAKVTLDNSRIDHNEPFSGGIANFGPSGTAILTLINSSVRDNGAFAAGGIRNTAGTLALDRSTVSRNAVAFAGGGIENRGDADGETTATLMDSTVSGNSACCGAAVYNSGEDGPAAVSLTNSTVSGNSPYFANTSTALYNASFQHDATMTLTNSTVSGNTCNIMIFNGDVIGTTSRLTVSNSTLGSSGGVLILNGGDGDGNAIVDLANTILKAGASAASIKNFSGTVTSQGYNLSSDPAGGDGSTGPGGLLGGPGDIRNTDPLLGPLKFNGGPTMTRALLLGSPSIDAGDPTFDPDAFDPPLLFDQRDGPGFPRIFGGRVDIGAFEARHP